MGKNVRVVVDAMGGDYIFQTLCAFFKDVLTAVSSLSIQKEKKFPG